MPDPLRMDAIELARARQLAADGTGRAARLKAGLSLAEVAAVCEDVEPSTVLRWETGERSPRGTPAIRYAELIDRLVARQRRKGVA